MEKPRKGSRLRQHREAAVGVVSPWEQLRQAPRLGERVAEKLRRLVDTNPGLKSRINAWIDFEDYTAAELYQIALNMLAEQGYNPDDAAAAALAEHLHRRDARRGQPDFGNDRDVRSLVDAVITWKNRRIVPYLGVWAGERLQVIEAGDMLVCA